MKPCRLLALLALNGAAIARAACPVPTDLRWSPVPTVAGDDLVLEMVQWNAGYLNDGTMEILPDRQVLVRTRSTSNFGVNPPISVRRKTIEDIAEGRWTITWSHTWITGGPSADPCPAVVAVIDVQAGTPPVEPAANAVPARSMPMLSVLAVVLGLVAAMVLRSERGTPR